ncbi:MAG: carbohydrate kinase, family protein [Actinomycetia bacterium]|nr:carbohydrate kinase, family protein [Actinomycetes bacterium]
MSEVTVGIDIGTGSVKAVAADADGNVLARARVPHDMKVTAPDRLEHDANRAWRMGTRKALKLLGRSDILGVSVAAMVPSLTAVDRRGVPHTPGLLYGDARGRTPEAGAGNPAETGELVQFLKWSMEQYPEARGFWPAQAVANHALSGEAVLDTSTAACAMPLFDWVGWNQEVMEATNVTIDQLPRLVPTGWRAGTVGGGAESDGPALASGCIDAMAEQLVAGADNDGDVLVILGTTLITWAVTTKEAAAPGCFTIPHTSAGKLLTGGPSNAGGLFINWALANLGRAKGTPDPSSVPVWAPYPRGERTPYNNPYLKGFLGDLDLMHDAVSMRRAAFEASAFITRRTIEAAGAQSKRVVLTGGGIRVPEWVQAMADATQLPVDCVAVPEGGALGSAFLARIAAGLESNMLDASRWARVGTRVEPDPRWVEPTNQRYHRFLELSDAVADGKI